MGSVSSTEQSLQLTDQQRQGVILLSSFEDITDTPTLSIIVTYGAMISNIEKEAKVNSYKNYEAAKGDLDKAIAFYRGSEGRPTVDQIKKKALEFYKARIKREK